MHGILSRKKEVLAARIFGGIKSVVDVITRMPAPDEERDKKSRAPKRGGANEMWWALAIAFTIAFLVFATHHHVSSGEVCSQYHQHQFHPTKYSFLRGTIDRPS